MEVEYYLEYTDFEFIDGDKNVVVYIEEDEDKYEKRDEIKSVFKKPKILCRKRLTDYYMIEAFKRCIPKRVGVIRQVRDIFSLTVSLKDTSSEFAHLPYILLAVVGYGDLNIIDDEKIKTLDIVEIRIFICDWYDLIFEIRYGEGIWESGRLKKAICP